MARSLDLFSHGRKIFFSAIFLLTVVILPSCSMRQFAIRQATPVFENAVDAFYEEEDLSLARPALASNLKLLEGLLKSDPDNAKIKLMLAQGYAGYALAFEEDTLPQAARLLYRRARNYALSVLHLSQSALKNPTAFRTFIKKTKRKDVPALFWSGFAWAGYINLSLEDPGALLDLPKVEAIMQRVRQLDSTYFYGAVYLFFGSIYGQKPRILGGDPQKAQAFFQKNLELTKGRFLLTYVYAAQYYAAKILDEALFEHYLQKVLQTPLSMAPQIKLLNQVAKAKARRLLKQKSELF